MECKYGVDLFVTCWAVCQLDATLTHYCNMSYTKIPAVGDFDAHGNTIRINFQRTTLLVCM